MKKITEITEIKYKTVREKDALGNRVPKKVQYQGLRKVNVVSGGKRFAHFFVDSLIYYILYYTVLFIFSALNPINDPLTSLIATYYISIFFMFSFPLYYIFFEGLLQRTPGKYLTKSIVINEYGKKPDIGQNILRNIIRLIPFETFSCLNEQGWHDRWSNTYVVTIEEYNKIQELLALEKNDAPKNTL